MTAETATPSVGTTAATLDFLAADFRVDSPEVWEAARRHWYATTPLGPAVLRYEDCAAMLRDKRFRQAGADHLAEQGITDGPLAEMWRDVILNIEGDRHGRLRRLVSRAFTPQAVDGLRPRMREIVHGLVDAFASAGQCEFMAACADHYPPRVMSDLLGIPDEDHEQFVDWGRTLALIIGYSVPQHAAAIDAARSDLYAATDWLCASRRLRPGDDLISRLVAAADGGDRLTTQELRSMIVSLVVGGQDSTRNQLGSALILFARHPDQWALLARRPDLAARATEEVMRLAPAAPFVWRRAVEDVVWRDLTIPAGTRVWLMVAAAHTDEATFGPDATRLDITAQRPPQLAFGHGVHYCLGAALTRAEIAEALPILAARLPGLELTGAPVLRPALSAFTGPISLEVRFRPVLRPERAMGQDPAYGIRQLVDIAERALSPGINDPSSAVQCLDHIHDLLRRIGTRAWPESVRCDEDGRRRVVVRWPTWDELVHLAFDEIRHWGAGSLQINQRMTGVLDDLLAVVPEQRRPPLFRQRQLLLARQQQDLPPEEWRQAGRVASPAQHWKRP